MKHNPYRFTAGATSGTVALTAVVATISLFTPMFGFAQQTAGGDTNPVLTKSSLTSEQVFAGVKETLDGFDSLSCNIRQTVVISGQRLHAAGRYIQASGNRMRLDYRIYPIRATKATDKTALQIDGEPEDVKDLKVTGSLTQVSDGNVLWSYWVNGDQKRLSRRNIREIMEASEGLSNYSTGQSLQDLGIGGLQTLMSQLQTGMEFGAVQEQQGTNSKYLVLSGRWSEKTKKDIFKFPDDGSGKMPDHLPDYVRIYVNKASKLPRRIQYLKQHPDPAQKRIRPLVTLDLREFETNADITDKTFEFVRPEGETLTEEDLTSRVIENIKRVAGQSPSAGDEKTEPASKK